MPQVGSRLPERIRKYNAAGWFPAFRRFFLQHSLDDGWQLAPVPCPCSAWKHMPNVQRVFAALVLASRVTSAIKEQLLSGCLFFAATNGNCSDLIAGGLTIQDELDVAFTLCEGSQIQEVVNGFAVTLRLFVSPDGIFYAHAATLRPGRQVLHFQTNYLRFQWQAAGKEVSWNARHFGTVAVFGQACGNKDTMSWPQHEWHVPRLRVRPQGCFPTPIAQHCCHPIRPQCWGYNQLLTFACCAVPYEPAFTSTCLVSNPVYPNRNQDCRGQPLNFFRAFHQGNELRFVVAGRIVKASDVNASLATGCLLQSVVYLFHELHHLSHNGEWLQAIPVQQLVDYVRLFQAPFLQLITAHQHAPTIQRQLKVNE